MDRNYYPRVTLMGAGFDYLAVGPGLVGLAMDVATIYLLPDVR